MVGIDIIENERINNSISEDFIKMILTKKEINYYNKKTGKKKLQYLCGRYCAKEAIIKCMGGIENPNMQEIEIINDNIGKPIVKYKNYIINVSISHENNYSVACAILIK